MSGRSLRLFIIAGEESGDRLAADLVGELAQRFDEVEVTGVGGDRLRSCGLQTLFPMQDISLMGISAVLAQLPRLLRRISQATDAALRYKPDAVVLVDAPDFNLRVAKKIRAANPAIPIIKWVSPTVWAWRPGRAAAMRPYIDHLLALLPFEPEVHRDLGGPPCTYTGHPLFSRRAEFRPARGERVPIGQADPARLLVLPGSRHGEIKAHAGVFGEALGFAKAHGARFEVVVPTLARLESDVRAAVSGWPVPVEVVVGEDARNAVFRSAHAALAASGTVTLELALLGVPHVVAYEPDRIIKALSGFIRSWSIILPNLILGRPVIREYLGHQFRPDMLGAALAALLHDTPERRAQIESFSELDSVMDTGARTPAEVAADAVLATIDAHKGGDRAAATPQG